MYNSYVVIRIFEDRVIELHYFKKNSLLNIQYPICFVVDVEKINILFDILSVYNDLNVLSTKHKLYLGKEIFRAYISIKLSQQYVQE
uniref:DUF4346 domain-containing protein n=1 Tax=Osmundaria fimbriata TaxID=228265 RepID=A0A1Z1M3Y2_OSMFI|nr:hypothetical protein [Osmundaria fimbriata]ARW60788.1 hypothetical protein [Osmundaria fimbriata]